MVTAESNILANKKKKSHYKKYFERVNHQEREFVKQTKHTIFETKTYKLLYLEARRLK